MLAGPSDHSAAEWSAAAEQTSLPLPNEIYVCGNGLLKASMNASHLFMQWCRLEGPLLRPT